MQINRTDRIQIDVISHREIMELMDFRALPCVSVYCPTHVLPSRAKENCIRFKNLLSKAVEKLVLGWGKRLIEAQELIVPARKLLHEDEFWQNQSDGLCFFIGPDFFRLYRVPVNFEEGLFLSSRFHLKPLLPLFMGNGQFYVLAISQHSIRLFQGTHYSIREIRLKDMPKGREDALRFHTRTSGSRAERDALFHGHGSSSEDSKEMTRLYLQKVDRQLGKIFNGNRVPLVLAGVEYMCSIFRKVSHYQNILPDAGIWGNPERFRPEELHEKAWEFVQSMFFKDLRRDLNSFEILFHTGKATNRIENIVPLAHEGRVETLFISVGGHIWGNFDPTTHQIKTDVKEKNGDQDLLDMTAVETIRHRGKVYALNEKEMPENSKIAAIFRY